MSTNLLNAPPPAAATAGVNAEDWAIVVGIDVYPGFKNLDLAAASNDARDMHDWLVGLAPTGGGVPKSQARLIRSVDFPGPFATHLDARPACAELERELLRLDIRAKQNNSAGAGLRVGRRLYLYFSGHGCAPEPDEAALLAADASPDLAGFHIPGRLWAHVFLVRGYFDEVILIMDCCRETHPTINIRTPPLNLTQADLDAVDRGLRAYAFATKWGRLAKEIQIDGKTHGVFTYAILQGLGGKAADPLTGEISAASLGAWVNDHMKDYLPQAINPTTFTPPEWGPDIAETKQIILARVKPATKSVRIDIPPAWVGAGVGLLDGFNRVFAQAPLAPMVWTLELLPGLYRLEGPGGIRQPPFEVER